MNIDQIINAIVSEVKKTGKRLEWNLQTSDRIKSMILDNGLPLTEFDSKFQIEVENRINAYFIKIDMLNFTQQKYEAFKQIYYNCIKSRNTEFFVPY